MSALLHRGATLVAVLLAAATGTAAAQNVMDDGKKLFNSGAVPACALCHALKHAGAAGEIGPALDELKPDAARIEKAIRNGIGQMPANPALSDAQIKLLGQYVARATGAAR